MTIFCLCFCLHALPSPTQPPQLVEGAADSSQGASQDDASGINARMKSIIKNLDRNDDEALSRSDVKTSWNRQGESGAAVPSNSISLVLTNTSTRYLIFRDIPLVCCLLAFLLAVYEVFITLFLSSFPFSIPIWTSLVLSCHLLVGAVVNGVVIGVFLRFHGKFTYCSILLRGRAGHIITSNWW